MGKKNSGASTPARAANPNQVVSLREETSGRTRVDEASLLRVKHLQRLAAWAGAEAGVGPVGALLGRRLAASAEAAGVPLGAATFLCQRCETVLKPGFNCTVRIRNKRNKAKRRKKSNCCQNSVSYACHFCGDQNLILGSGKGVVKSLLPSREHATMDSSCRILRGNSSNTRTRDMKKVLEHSQAASLQVDLPSELRQSTSERGEHGERLKCNLPLIDSKMEGSIFLKSGHLAASTSEEGSIQVIENTNDEQMHETEPISCENVKICEANATSQAEVPVALAFVTPQKKKLTEVTDTKVQLPSRAQHQAPPPAPRRRRLSKTQANPRSAAPVFRPKLRRDPPLPPAKMPNLECRMYEPRFPEVDAAVMIQVKHIADMGAYVSLLEYNNIEGMILFSELSRRRIRSISSLIKVGRQEPAIVLRVDRDKGYIDLSKRRVSEEEAHACEDRYNKSKLVHSIMRHVAETLEIDLEPLYQRICWPLYRKYGHAFEAFKLIVADPDSILDALTYEEKETGPDGQEVTKVVPAVTPEVKDSLVKNIRRRMTPQPLKIRADVEMKCFQFDGVLHIKQAMKKAEASGNDNCPVKIKLVAPPLYVLTTQTLDKEQGISVLTDAIKACTAEIEKYKGKLVVKEPPRAVSEREDKLFLDQINSLMAQNEEVDGDDDSEEEEDTGMGDVDLTNTGVTAY